MNDFNPRLFLAWNYAGLWVVSLIFNRNLWLAVTAVGIIVLVLMWATTTYRTRRPK